MKYRPKAAPEDRSQGALEKIFIFESQTNTGDGHLCPELLFPSR
jgi:hypothetical protein